MFDEPLGAALLGDAELRRWGRLEWVWRDRSMSEQGVEGMRELVEPSLV